jgi:hypothetical protein
MRNGSEASGSKTITKSLMLLGCVRPLLHKLHTDYLIFRFSLVRIVFVILLCVLKLRWFKVRSLSQQVLDMVFLVKCRETILTSLLTRREVVWVENGLLL